MSPQHTHSYNHHETNNTFYVHLNFATKQKNQSSQFNPPKLLNVITPTPTGTTLKLIIQVFQRLVACAQKNLFSDEMLTQLLTLGKHVGLMTLWYTCRHACRVCTY